NPTDRERKGQLRPTGNSSSRNGDPELPESAPAVAATERIARPGPGKPLEGIALSTAARRKIGKRPETTQLALLNNPPDVPLSHAVHVAEADANGARLRPALGIGRHDARRQNRDPPPLRLMDEGVRRIEPHRLLVEQ